MGTPNNYTGLYSVQEDLKFLNQIGFMYQISKSSSVGLNANICKMPYTVEDAINLNLNLCFMLYFFRILTKKSKKNYREMATIIGEMLCVLLMIIERDNLPVPQYHLPAPITPPNPINAIFFPE